MKAIADLVGLRALSAARKAMLYAGLALWIAALGAFSNRHLARTDFWFDESMQFWMSLGIDGLAPPHTLPGSFLDVIRQNAATNLDPGGFSVVLALWLKRGVGEVWQRTLPLLFFTGGMAGFGWIGWTLRRSLPFAMLSSLVPAAYPLILDFATEVRAYSMEFAGIALGCILIDRLMSRPSVSSALAAGMGIGAFLGSRYSFGIFAAAAMFGVMQQALGTGLEARSRALRWLPAFVAPIGIAAVLIFWVALWPQFWIRISYHDGELVRYLARTTTAGKSWHQIASLLAENLFGLAGIPLTLAALIGLAASAPRRWSERLGIDRIAPGTVLFGRIALAALCLTALLWRWHPWDMAQRWSLWLNVLSGVALVHIAASVLALLAPSDASWWESDRRLALLMLLGVVALDLRMAFYRRTQNTLVPTLTYLERAAPAADQVAVDLYWYPTARYFYEYGALSGSRIYPASFSFPDPNALDRLVSPRTQFLVTPLSLQDARARFPQATISREPDWPAYLFRIEMPAAKSAPSDG